MGKKDKRIDSYINKSADFAKPILKHFRKLMHEACPELEEKIKWGFPHFDYNEDPLSSMAAFKNHCTIGFWKAVLMKDADMLNITAKSEVAMGHLGKITSLKDLPKDTLLKKYIKEGMRLNEQGIKLSAKTRSGGAVLKDVPRDFAKALSKNKKAQKTFENFSTSNKNEYLQWVTDAKTDATRQKRLLASTEWMSEGKVRNWKYL